MARTSPLCSAHASTRDPEEDPVPVLPTRPAPRAPAHAPISAALAALAALAVAFLLAPRPSLADALDDVKSSGKLMWCADQEGGGPYVFPREDDPNQVTGFEVDLAARLASYMNVQPEFVQGQWDKLPDMLRTKKCHLVLNGYELTPERLEIYDATIPYYVYGLQLMIRKGDPDIKTWDDMRKPRGGTARIQLGVLVGSAAETLGNEFCGGDCDVIAYDGNTDAMREVETGKLDATIQDTPIAAFYAPRFPTLQFLDAPRGEGHYVAYVNQDEEKLLAALNDAVVLMVRNGDLERIYRTYGIWDENQQKLSPIVEAARFFGYEKAATAAITESQAAMPTEATVRTEARKRGWEVVRTYGKVMLESAGITVILSVMSFPLAILVGLLIAVGRMYGPGWLRAPLTIYVEFLRGTPLMLQLYFVFFFLPEVGINVPAFWTGILGLAINYSAYESEIYRAGLQAIPKGQMEAALSLGMSRGQALQRIVVPQAFTIVIPPVVNDFIALFKDTSVCSVVTLVELTKRFSVLSMSTQATIELMLMTAVLYLAMSYPMSLLSRHVEKRLGTEHVG
jgi:polar amino acid transport system substrate-binding protein